MSKAEEIDSEVVLDKIWTIINKSLKDQKKELLLSCSEMQDIEYEIEQFSEHRIKQEREKWEKELEELKSFYADSSKQMEINLENNSISKIHIAMYETKRICCIDFVLKIDDILKKNQQQSKTKH